MSRLTGWWSRRSSAGKVELYTRWTFHFFAPIEWFVLGGLPLSRDASSPLSTVAAGGLCLWICVHSVLCAVLASRALDHTTGKRRRPVRLATTVAVVTFCVDLVLNLLWADGTLPDGAVIVSVLAGTSVFTLCALVLCIGPVRHMAYALLGTAVATGAPIVAAGNGADTAAGSALGILVGGVFVCLTSGFSSWLLRIVQELEHSRDLKARLAVAEERLRFGRDLHDVMGRNLSVIALKSELAVRLALRERPEAVDQMVEVQRIAQESQREVREVVRGYREADLRVELEGARGVLGAAGIACAVDAPALDLPPEVQSALGWVVRETTTNVLRHGDARRCAIVLRAEPGAVLLTVENDGAEGKRQEEDRAAGEDCGRAGKDDGRAREDDGRVAGDDGRAEGVVAARNVAAGGVSVGDTSAGAGSVKGASAGGGSVKGALVGGGSVRGRASFGGGPVGGVGRGGQGIGSGLAGLRERLGAVDGTLEAGPTAPHSFRVTARVPLPRAGRGRPVRTPAALGHPLHPLHPVYEEEETVS